MYYAEHRFLGDTITVEDSKDSKANGSLATPISLQLENGLLVTYGEINGFAGDYFGFEKPISAERDIEKRKDIFQRWFDLLGFSPGGKAKAEALRTELKQLNDEADKVMRSPLGGTADQLAAVYKSHPLDLFKLDGISKDSRWANGASFMQLLEANVDHFAEEARLTYNAGHALALDWASKGEITKALAINAFADHFLEDSFAAGHLRVPRGKIAEVASSNTSIIPGFSKIINACSNVMHEEDGELGLWVQSPSGERWKAFGDGRLPGNVTGPKVTTTNRDQCRKALEASVREVYTAQKDKMVIQPQQFTAWTHAPIIDEIAKDPENHNPLVKVEGGTISRRVNGLKSETYEKTVDLADWLRFYTENLSRVEDQIRVMAGRILGLPSK